jgi:UDP-3-O-[3-hydroxymyristoyl] glucosamine N-acyltransferase
LVFIAASVSPLLSLSLSESKAFRVDALAERLGGSLIGDGSVLVSGIASLIDADPTDLSLYADPRYRRELSSTKAGALVTRERLADLTIPQIVHPDPFLALAVLVDLFHPHPSHSPGIDEKAWVAPSARIAPDVTVYPFAYIGEGAEVGARTVLHPGVFLGAGASVGEDSVLWPNVTIREGCRIGKRVVVHPGAVLGADGFGFARRDGKFVKIRHVGIVVVEDDVEIGANAAIDRGTLGRTLIRRGVKIDNLVHIAHNVEVGEDSAMAAQVGISGSTVIGKRVLIGGQVGLVDHLTVGDEAVLIAQSGVIGDVPGGATLSGFPARPHREVLKTVAELRGLERLKERLRRLEREVRALRAVDGIADGEESSEP